MALLLGRPEHRVAVVDRWPRLYLLPRAVHFNHEVARILQSAGVADEVMSITERIDFLEWCNEKDEVLLQLDWGGKGASGWSVASMVSQPELERLLDCHSKTNPWVILRQRCGDQPQILVAQPEILLHHGFRSPI